MTIDNNDEVPEQTQTTAIAVIVNPTSMEQVAAEVPATRILWDILFAG